MSFENQFVTCPEKFHPLSTSKSGLVRWFHEISFYVLHSTPTTFKNRFLNPRPIPYAYKICQCHLGVVANICFTSPAIMFSWFFLLFFSAGLLLVFRILHGQSSSKYHDQHWNTRCMWWSYVSGKCTIIQKYVYIFLVNKDFT